MKREEAAEILAIHDAWRRGGLSPMYCPPLPSEALDLAIEALRESAEGEKEQAQRWYLKGFEDAETTERQPVTLEQTMRDAETHFHFVWDANEALRESAEPAELTKEQWGLFCDIFHQEHDAWSWSEPAHRDIPAATFEAVVRMVERYMALREQPELSKSFIEALEEVIRISDREHDAWNEVKAFLTKQRKNKSHD